MIKKLACAVAVMSLLSVPSFAGSVAAVARDGADKTYTFSVPQTGKIYVDLMWKQPHDDLIFVVACVLDDIETLAYGIPEGLRGPVSLEMDALGGSSCAIIVITVGKPGAFTLSVDVKSGHGTSVKPSKSLGLVEDAETGDSMKDLVSVVKAAIKGAP